MAGWDGEDNGLAARKQRDLVERSMRGSIGAPAAVNGTCSCTAQRVRIVTPPVK